MYHHRQSCSRSILITQWPTNASLPYNSQALPQPVEMQGKARSKMFKPEEGIKAKKGPSFKASLGKGKTNAKLHILSWNVNGIRNSIAKQHLTRFIHKFQPDIFCINETKIDGESWTKNPITINGYSGYWSFCKVSTGYSGVAIFSKTFPIDVIEDLEEEQYSQEGRVLTVQFESFYLIAVYVPSAGQKLDRLDYKINKFEVAFHKHCNKYKQIAKQKGKAIIVCGDLNTAQQIKDTHLAKGTHRSPGFTELQRRSLRNFISTGWVDTFRKLNPDAQKYSWWHIKLNGRQNRVGKRLDYFLVDPGTIGCVTQADVYEDFLGSDHSPIGMKIDLTAIMEKRALEVSISHYKQGCEKVKEQQESKVQSSLNGTNAQEKIELLKQEQAAETFKADTPVNQSQVKASEAQRVGIKDQADELLCKSS